MCAPMGLWLSTSVGPFCPAHLDGASYANEIPQNGPPAVIVQSNRGWNHPFGVVFFSADPFKGKERYRKVSSFWLCCNTADWGRGTWAYLASCSHSIWWLSYFNRCRTKVTLLAVRNWNLRCLYIYIQINWINWRLRTDSLMLILRGRMSGNQLLPSLAALRCVARLFHQGWLSGLLWPPHASLISNKSQHRQGQQSLCSESQPIKLKDRGVLVVQWTDVANGKRMTVSSTHNSSMIQFW